MPTNTSGGTTTSFSNTPQAQTDYYSYDWLTEDWSGVFCFDVMSNDLGGNAKVLWSIDDGTNSTSSTLAGADLLVQDTARAECTSSDTSRNGAKIWITSDGKVGYDSSTLSAGFKASLQALGVGESTTDTFTYAIRLSNGTLSWTTVTIVYQGANDGVQMAATAAAGATEDTVVTSTGTATFTDVDLHDHHTATVAPGSGNHTHLGTFSIGAVTESNGSGSVGWTYQLDNDAAQYLSADDTVTETYVITVDDGHGGAAHQTVTVTIHGTNDTPVIVTGGDASGAVQEDSAIGTDGKLHDSGSFGFTDVDLSDHHNVSVTAHGSGYLGTLSATVSDDSTGDGAGRVDWNFSVDNTAVQYLGENETLEQIYDVTVDDGHGGTRMQQVTVTITGTNDSPEIQIIGGDTVAAARNETNAGLTASGTLTVLDPDLHDSVDITVASVSVGGTGGDGGIDHNVLLGMLGLAGNTANAADGTQGSLGWTFDSVGQAFDYLPAGQTLVLTYTLAASDGHSGSDTQEVTITITGTNDAAVITEAAGADHALVESGGEFNALAGDSSAHGTLHVTDADTGEGHFVAATTGSLNGTYGTFTFNETTGEWTYALDDSRSATQALVQDQHVTDTLTVHSADGTAYDVVVNVTGTNDAAVITETGFDHDVVEAGGVANGTAGDPSASGTLHVTDVDAGQGAFVAATTAELAGTYGTFAFDESTGQWSYSLNNDSAATQALNVGDPATDTLVVHSDDGTAYTVTVNITGSNDAPTVAAALVSDKHEGDGAYSLDLLQGASDVDDGETATLAIANVTYSVDGHAATATAPAGIGLGGSSLGVDPTNAAFNHLAQGQTTTIVVSYDVTDAHGATVAQTETITITGTNDTPTVDVALTSNADEGDTSYTLDLLQGASDPDDGETATLAVSGISYSVDGGAAIHTAPVGVSLSGSTLTVDPSNGAFDHLGEGDHTTIVVSYNVTDVHGAITAQTETITINGTNDAPVVTAGGGISYTENETAAAINAALTVTDVDSANLTGATVSITGNFASGEDLLGFVDQNGISGSYDASTGVLTLSGTASVADYEAALRSVTYANSSDDPSADARTISFQVDDGASLNHGSNVGTSTVTVTPVNDAPVNVLPATFATNEDVAVKLAGLSVSDADAGSAALSVTLGVATGTLSAVSGGGVTVTGSGTGSLVLSGSQSDINAFLASASTQPTYVPVANANGDVTLTMTTSDNGHSGGAALSDIDTSTISITAVNDAPVATIAPATYSAVEQVNFNLHGTGLSISDVDSGSGSMTVTLSVTEGALNIAAGTTGALVSNSGTSSVTITGTQAQINALLAGNGSGTVVYNDNTDTPSSSATLTLTVHDNGNTGGGDLSSTDTAIINITAVNDAAVISGATSGSVTEDAVPNTVTGDLNSTDVDGTADSWTVVNSATASANGYGTYTIDATGHWTYVLDNTNSAVNALNNGGTLSDSFTVTTADGTSQVVSVTINGHTDVTDVLAPTDIVFSLAGSTGALTGNGINAGMTLGSLTAVDADSASWSYAIGSVLGQTLPALTVSPGSGGSVNLLTSGNVAAGQYAFTVTATDTAGHSYTESYTLSVGTPQGDGFGSFTITNGTSATNGTDISLGLNGGDVIKGGAGDDALVGGNGADFLYGGLGNDQLIGGQNNDTFVFDSALGSNNVDTIFDFEAGGGGSNQTMDFVQLDHAIFAGLSVGGLQTGVSFVSNSTGAASGTHAQIIFNSTTGDLYYDSDGTGSQGPVLFAHLTFTGTVDASDFNVI